MLKGIIFVIDAVDVFHITGLHCGHFWKRTVSTTDNKSGKKNNTHNNSINIDL